MKDSCDRKNRIIMHVDMDHFFSAVEEREHPEFKGKPVVVGAHPNDGKGRGVVKTCNYLARKYGIHSGMPISRAWNLCPTAIYVRGDYQLYRAVSEKIMTILRRYSEKLQQWGLDEAFLDVSLQAGSFEEATDLAVNVKYEILWNEELTCSIGIAPNKLVAKIASDFKKPDGLTVVRGKDVQKFLSPLPVRKMLWIGEKTERKLHQMGVETIGDLSSFDVHVLVEKFGIMGARYHRYAHGIYESEVGMQRGRRKSLGSESTFTENTDDLNVISDRLNNLCDQICKRSVKHNLLFRTVTVKIRYASFRTHSHGKTMPFFTNRSQDLRKAVQEITHANLCRKEKVRLVGVRVSSLRSDEAQRALVEKPS